MWSSDANKRLGWRPVAALHKRTAKDRRYWRRSKLTLCEKHLRKESALREADDVVAVGELLVGLDLVAGLLHKVVHVGEVAVLGVLKLAVYSKPLRELPRNTDSKQLTVTTFSPSMSECT